MGLPQFTCPACGEEVHPNSQACPSCGIRPEAGWNTGSEISDGNPHLGVDDDFDYDEFVSREFDSKGNLRDDTPPPIARMWILTAIGLLLAILFLILSGLW